MKINKVVFANLSDFDREDLEFLEKKSVIINTDYGTTEIIANCIQTLQEEFGDEADKILEMLNCNLGEDVVLMLQNGDLDFVLCTWD